jgi:phosphoenolpyruvate carboxylase
MTNNSLENFNRNVADKYTIYNSLFAALPFSGVANAGALLPILLQTCLEGYANKKTPTEIIDGFFSQHTKAKTEQEKADRMFKFVQYIERQVVLFDSIEDAAFTSVHDMEGAGTLKRLFNDAAFARKTDEMKRKLQTFKVRVVLTAHPTQFYPGTVLGIIHDMAHSIEQNDFHTINQYIQQLGITPFFNKKQPTPYDEAVNLMWYLENILYHSIGNIYNLINKEVFDKQYNGDNPFVELGFWPGGDRDGNPFVDAATTLKVARALKSTIILCYYRDVRRLSRRLTFTGVDKMMNNLQQLLYENVFNPNASSYVTKAFLLQVLYEIRQLIIDKHHRLFLDQLDSLIHKVKIFGTYFAALDVRQNSKIHGQVLKEIDEVLKRRGEAGILPEGYEEMDDNQKLNVLSSVRANLNPVMFADITKDTIESVYAIAEIQNLNGEAGCHRYIISNCTSAANVMEVYALFRLCGWHEENLNIDIVPLFETIDDLADAEAIMEQLYKHEVYSKHLNNRGKDQTVMVGFSDGTKDGGYLQANWSIYKAKERLTAVSRKYDICVKFFDGRGGPPSRGGGRSNRFYASLGADIENDEIQLTIQGQTITSNFGTIQSSQFNIEQLLSAGIANSVFSHLREQLSESHRQLLDDLSATGYESYQKFKGDPLFLPYLQELSPLNYYSKTNIASRPAKRGDGSQLKFEDLRAIPFVGSWSQLKQNVPGFYGVGTALKHADEKGLLNNVKEMYDKVLFFKTLMDNSIMSMLKTFFPLTQHYANHEKYGAFWNKIYNEFKLTNELVLKVASAKELMEDDLSGRASIIMRDRIVIPLLTIQQYALQKLNALQDEESEMKKAYENLLTRSMFGIINASRNSA